MNFRSGEPILCYDEKKQKYSKAVFGVNIDTKKASILKRNKKDARIFHQSTVAKEGIQKFEKIFLQGKSYIYQDLSHLSERNEANHVKNINRCLKRGVNQFALGRYFITLQKSNNEPIVAGTHSKPLLNKELVSTLFSNGIKGKQDQRAAANSFISLGCDTGGNGNLYSLTLYSLLTFVDQLLTDFDRMAGGLSQYDTFYMLGKLRVIVTLLPYLYTTLDIVSKKKNPNLLSSTQLFSFRW